MQTSLQFIQFPTALSPTSPLVQVVYLALRSFYNKHTLSCFPSQQTIANKANVSVRSARWALHQLKKAGFIQWQTTTSKACTYRFIDQKSWLPVSHKLLQLLKTPREIAVFLALYPYFANYGFCHVSYKKLAKESGVASVGSVSGTITTLEARGVVKIARRKGKSNLVSPNLGKLKPLFLQLADSSSSPTHREGEGFQQLCLPFRKSAMHKTNGNKILNVFSPCSRTLIQVFNYTIGIFQKSIMGRIKGFTPIGNGRQARDYIRNRFEAWVKEKKEKNNSFAVFFDVEHFIDYYSWHDDKTGKTYFVDNKRMPIWRETLLGMFSVWQKHGNKWHTEEKNQPQKNQPPASQIKKQLNKKNKWSGWEQ